MNKKLYANQVETEFLKNVLLSKVIENTDSV